LKIESIWIIKGKNMDKPISIMPCLDMQNGRVVKGVHFIDIRDAGDPVECAKAYCAAGADELALLDITATVENRPTMLDVVKKVSAAATVPFTVGGGIRDVASAAAVIEAGADTVSVSSAAFRNPEIIPEMIAEFGPDKVTVAIDVDVNESLPSGYEVYVDGGRTATGADGQKKWMAMASLLSCRPARPAMEPRPDMTCPSSGRWPRFARPRLSPREEPANSNTSTMPSKPARRFCWRPQCFTFI
jgi:hypothetical protein